MIELSAPAKLNLGLEIIGKRPDGYHDLRTLFCAVSLCDRITITPTDRTIVTISDPDLVEANLVQRVIDIWDQAELPRAQVAIHIEKRIPAAAGLGGASSDAATVLGWLADEAAIDRTEPKRTSLAAALGSDVPFFLSGGQQIGAGRGEILTRLPFAPLAAVIITPNLQIQDKTRSLFAALRPEDFSDGSTVDALIAGLPDSITETTAPLINSFQRPLYDLYPELGNLAQAIYELTGRLPSITGAGPTMFLPVTTIEHARELQANLIQIPLPLAPTIVSVQSLEPSNSSPDAHA